MKKYLLLIIPIVLFISCEDKQEKDCAGVLGGNNTCENLPPILSTEEFPTIEIPMNTTLLLVSSADIWNDGYASDPDNTLEELTFTLSIDNPNITIDWDGGYYSNPVLIPAQDFVGNAVITLCISDDEYTTCGTNDIVVYWNLTLDCAGEWGGTAVILTYWYDADNDDLGAGEIDTSLYKSGDGVKILKLILK